MDTPQETRAVHGTLLPRKENLEDLANKWGKRTGSIFGLQDRVNGFIQLYSSLEAGLDPKSRATEMMTLTGQDVLLVRDCPHEWRRFSLHCDVLLVELDNKGDQILNSEYPDGNCRRRTRL